ncbi:MAG: Ig-like domain-containing protein [Propionibacteriaceae bacterium]|nr:Ig-like domain-containing protein [Propionibacteriaceae bacterium]
MRKSILSTVAGIAISGLLVAATPTAYGVTNQDVINNLNQPIVSKTGSAVTKTIPATYVNAAKAELAKGYFTSAQLGTLNKAIDEAQAMWAGFGALDFDVLPSAQRSQLVNKALATAAQLGLKVTYSRTTKEIQVVDAITRIHTATPKTIYLPIKQNTTIPVSVYEGYAISKVLPTFTSSNTKIVKVDKNGKITALKKTGTAKVTIKANKKSFVVTVKVVKKAKTAKSIKCSIPASLKVGKSHFATYTLNTAKAKHTGTVKFTSSNKKIVSVSKNGHLKALKKGKVTITVKISGKTHKETVKVK